MTRREILNRFWQLGILTAPFSSKLVRAMEGGDSGLSDPEFVLIYDSTSSLDYQKLLSKAGPYLAERNARWRQKLIVWDVNHDGKKIRAFKDKYGRNTESFVSPILIAVPPESEEFEVETWTLDWLSYSESRYTDACYPISGGWWSVEGDWNPSIQKVRNHVFKSPNHASGKFESAWLDLLKFEELQSLHSDHHREMTNQGKVYWKNVNKECPSEKVSLGLE